MPLISLAELEQQDGEREPHDRRHRLQAGDQRADRRPQRGERGHGGADHGADQHRQGEAGDRAEHGQAYAVPEVRGGDEAAQVFGDRSGPGQDVRRFPAGRRHQLPDRQHDDDGQQLRPCAAPDALAARALVAGRPLLERVQAGDRVAQVAPGLRNPGLDAGLGAEFSWHVARPPRGAGR
jgi:hypothetical protein